MAKRPKHGDDDALDLHVTRQKQTLDLELLDKQLATAQFRVSLDERQLKLDERRLALDKEVHEFNCKKRQDEYRELETSQRALSTLLNDRQTLLDDKETLLREFEDTSCKRLDDRDALLTKSEEVLRNSKYVCTICLNPVADGSLRALSPCGHCFCITCVTSHGITCINPDLFHPQYEGACPRCRCHVGDMTTLYL